jgi:hypothetical protein
VAFCFAETGTLRAADQPQRLKEFPPTPQIEEEEDDDEKKKIIN